MVNHRSTYGLHCTFSKGSHPCHAALNVIIKRPLDAAKIPIHLEPTGLYQSDGKRADRAYIVPWRGGKVLGWDATCPDILPPSYISLATREANVVVNEAEKQKKAQYASHHFVPIAVKFLWVFGAEARILLQDLDRSLKDSTSEPLPHHHPIQRISMAVQGAMQLPS